MAYKTLGSFNFDEKNIKLTFFFLFYSLLKKKSFSPLIKETQHHIKPWKKLFEM